MARATRGSVAVFLVGLFLSLVPAISRSEPAASPGLPPISQQLVREGDFAIKLYSALGLGTVQDETEAESGLGQAGIMPRNGWIADYPVTPDIFGELQRSVGDAAANRSIPQGKEAALQTLEAVSAETSLGIKPQTGLTVGEVPSEEVAQDYPNPAAINDYYQEEGPPVVTYYTPPPDYYYLYGWIPYPFWCDGFWFPGYFILHDFHRSFHRHNRVFFVSNHFNDIRSHRVFRVDPVSRFNGRTFAGIGMNSRRGFLSTGVPRSQRSIFNAPRAQAAPGMRPLPGMRPSFHPSGSGGNLAPAGRGRARTFAAPSRGARTFSSPSRSAARSFSAPSRSGAGTFSAPSRGAGRSSSAPASGGAGRGMSAPSGGHGGAAPRGR